MVSAGDVDGAHGLHLYIYLSIFIFIDHFPASVLISSIRLVPRFQVRDSVRNLTSLGQSEQVSWSMGYILYSHAAEISLHIIFKV